MEYTIVNGAGAIARGVTKALSKNCSKIKLLDTRVYRNGVYKLQEELEGVELEKSQTVSSKSLEYAIEGSDTVVYFTHDYLSMSYAKGTILEATARAAKACGVSKLIWVSPIESDFYYTEDSLSPTEIKAASEERALTMFPDLVMLHPNLVYGEYSYLIRYMTQSILGGKIYKSLADPDDKTMYYPTDFESLAEVINHAIENYDTVSGNVYSVRGESGITLSQIKDLITKKCSTDNVSVTSQSLIGNLLGEFFRGIGHDQNMCMMADYFKENSWDFTSEDDYHSKNDLPNDFNLEQGKYFNQKCLCS